MGLEYKSPTGALQLVHVAKHIKYLNQAAVQALTTPPSDPSPSPFRPENLAAEACGVVDAVLPEVTSRQDNAQHVYLR
jgi:hypothetical protein